MEALRELLDLIWGLLLSLRQTVNIRDLFDILIAAYLIYRILSFMRKTSANSVIKGIAFILIVAWLSTALKLSVLSYLLRLVLQMGIIVIVVLFQPELRKMFEQMGTSRLNLLFRRHGRFETIEACINGVIAASDAMAKNETGALMVFEREIGLNDFAVTGTKVDALVTSELIQNIFYHNSPLHDGAMILREGRLLAAACMLPLSNNVNLSRDLGMRHRAGVGISERSDAVVIIVSEETGTISVAIDGMLKRHLTMDTFEMLLRNELLSNDSPGKKGKPANKSNKTNKPKNVKKVNKAKNPGDQKEGQKK